MAFTSCSAPSLSLVPSGVYGPVNEVIIPILIGPLAAALCAVVPAPLALELEVELAVELDPHAAKSNDAEATAKATTADF